MSAEEKASPFPFVQTQADVRARRDALRAAKAAEKKAEDK